MLKFLPEKFRRIPAKFKIVSQRLDPFIQGVGGYKVFIYINLAILLLVVVLILLQQSWINREKRVIEEMVEVHTRGKAQEESEALEMTGRSDLDIMKEERRSKNELLITINKKIKEADLYFEFEQYDKAARIYKELSSAKSAFNEKDKVVNNLAECYFHLGDFELAMETYRKILKDFFNTAYRLNAQLGEGKCLIRLGKFSEARRVLYLMVAKEGKYDEKEDKSKVIEAYYKIAESYIAQAKEHKDKTQVTSNPENL